MAAGNPFPPRPEVDADETVRQSEEVDKVAPTSEKGLKRNPISTARRKSPLWAAARLNTFGFPRVILAHASTRGTFSPWLRSSA